VSNLFLSIAAVAIVVAVPGTAAAQTAAQRPAGTAAAQATPNRATVIRGLDANFKAIDTNGDGTLNSAELAAAQTKAQQLQRANMRTRIDGQFTRLDTNKDGQLSRAEFLAAAPNPPATPANGANLVARLDLNKDGRVSADEYRSPILTNFDRMDTNRDGTVTPAERQAAATRK
jgi:hypothetical protein